jgi:hypothetical protein
MQLLQHQDQYDPGPCKRSLRIISPSSSSTSAALLLLS